MCYNKVNCCMSREICVVLNSKKVIINVTKGGIKGNDYR